MTDPLVIQHLNQFRADLLNREAAQMATMAQRWLRVEGALEQAIATLAEDIELRRNAGESVSRSALLRLERYQALLAQAQQEVNQYINWAATTIADGQLAWARLGIDSSVQALQDVYFEAGVVGATFNRLPVDAVNDMIGLAGDGSPLRTLLGEVFPTAVDGLTQELVNATAKGQNPRVTARAMKDGFGMGLDRALTTARTEQFRVFRESGRRSYQQSGVVTSYFRLAAKQTRTCLGCLMADGDEVSLDVPFKSHPNCRCTPVPRVRNLPRVQFQTGREWFLAQSEATQRAMMGAKTFDAWKGGRFGLDRLVKVVRSDTWGDAIVARPLKELIQ